MFIQIDSREDKNYRLEFDHPYIEGAFVKKLDAGDYQAHYKGNNRSIHIFERKSKSDAFGTFSGDPKNFRNELLLAKENGNIIILITECSFHQILKGYKYSPTPGRTILRKIWTISEKYNMPVVFCNSRKHMVEYITEFFIYSGYKRLYHPAPAGHHLPDPLSQKTAGAAVENEEG